MTGLCLAFMPVNAVCTWTPVLCSPARKFNGGVTKYRSPSELRRCDRHLLNRLLQLDKWGKICCFEGAIRFFVIFSLQRR